MTAKSGSEALGNADRYTSYDVGYCLKWVRTCWGVGSLYGSAIEAWNGARKKHPGDRNPPTGAPCFYRGGTYGHIVVFRERGSSKIRSTDCQTAGRVSNDALSWPERTWGQTYLGWTEDLNGVELPIDASDDKPEGDDMPTLLRAKTTKDVKLKAGSWYPIVWDNITNNADDFTSDKTGMKIGGRAFVGTIGLDVSARGGGNVRTSWVERAGGETLETMPVAAHTVDHVVDTRSGKVGSDRILRARVLCDHDATLEAGALLEVLIW